MSNLMKVLCIMSFVALGACGSENDSRTGASIGGTSGGSGGNDGNCDRNKIVLCKATPSEIDDDSDGFVVVVSTGDDLDGDFEVVSTCATSADLEDAANELECRLASI